MTDFKNGPKRYLSQIFSGLVLPSAEISTKEFEGCTFKDCNFSEAQFAGCKFIDCVFVQCNLSLAKMGYSKFSDVTFEECKMVGIDWTRAAWSRYVALSPVKLYKCIINDSSFLGLTLEELVIEDCKAHDVDFREGNFTDANFTYTDFTNSMFNQTNLTSVDFSEATNYTIDIYANEIKKAKFSRYEAVRLLESIGIELVD